MFEAQPPPIVDDLIVEPFETEYEPVDGGYGWVNVICMVLLTAHTWGVNGAFGVYLAYYIDTNHFPGANPMQYAFVGGLSISQVTCISALVTKFSRHFGLRSTLLLGAVLETCGLIGASFATKVWHLYVAQGVLFGWGCCFQFVAAIGIVAQWFKERRSFAASIASAGSGLGGLIWSLACGAMINTVGFRWSLRITALVSFSMNVVCAFLMKDRNHHINPNQRAFDFKLFKNREFVLLLIWGFFSLFGYTILLFSLPHFAITIGLSQQEAVVVGAMLNFGMAVGRPIVGYFSDSVGGVTIAAAATFFASVVCFFTWMFADSFPLLVIAAILGGSVCGTFWATFAPLTGNAVGLKELPSGISIILTSTVIPCLFAEPIALGLQSDSHLSYKSVQIFAGSMFLAGAISLLILRGFKVHRLRSLDNGSPESTSPHNTTEARQGNVVRRWVLTAFSSGKF